MGENRRAREGESERGREKSVAFVCKIISMNHRNARSVYIFSQKPGLRHLSRLSKKSNIGFKRIYVILNETKVGGSPPT